MADDGHRYREVNLAVIEAMKTWAAEEAAARFGPPKGRSMAKANKVPKAPAKIDDFSTFVAIAQPEYSWVEKTVEKKEGSTILPRKEGDPLRAQITVPNGKLSLTPEGRFIRIHEMLHARYTPEIQKLAFGPEGQDISAMALQLAEDVRLHSLGRKAGVLKDGGDTYIQNEFFADLQNTLKRSPSPTHTELKLARVYMGTYGAPMEDGWDSKDLDWFQTATNHRLSRRTKRLLKAWSRMAEKAVAEPDTAKSFIPLAQKSDKLMRLIMEQKQPPGTPMPMPDQDHAQAQAAGSDLNKAQAAQEKHRKELERLQEENAKIVNAHAKAKKQAERSELEKEYSRNTAQQTSTAQSLKDASDSVEYFEGKLKQLETNSMASYAKTAKVSQWVPAAFDNQQLHEMEMRAEAMDTNWMPTLIEHDSEYKPWEGLKPKEASPNDYSLDPMARGWGKMHMRLAPLERNFRAIVKQKGVAAPEGPIPKFFNRWFGEKDVFERKGRRRGGTLLLDISGSMGWSHAQTMALIEKTPAMTIAAYSSSKNRAGEDSDRSGRLTIIAQHGRLVSKDFNLQAAEGPLGGGHSGGNVVDGPALSWLCRQARPRVWFSDGQVTGTGEASNDKLYADSRRLQKLGGIMRTTDIETVVKVFNGDSIDLNAVDGNGDKVVRTD